MNENLTDVSVVILDCTYFKIKKKTTNFVPEIEEVIEPPEFWWKNNCEMYLKAVPIPVAARSEAWVCLRSRLLDCGFKSHRGYACLSVVSDVCCQVQFSASGWSLVQSIPTVCGMSECDCEALRMSYHGGKKKKKS